MEKIGNAQKNLVEKYEWKKEGNIKMNLKISGMRIWTGFSWLRTRPSDGSL
jgi:hypothetical protein